MPIHHRLRIATAVPSTRLPPVTRYSSPLVAQRDSLLSRHVFWKPACHISGLPFFVYQQSGQHLFSRRLATLTSSIRDRIFWRDASTRSLRFFWRGFSIPAVLPVDESLSLPRPFKYLISAAFAAKQNKLGSTSSNIVSYGNGTATLSTSPSRPDAGQDAFFISHTSQGGAVALGVADGVGGYAEAGIDSADFSHTFCERMATAARTASDTISPKSLIATGYQRVLDEDMIAGGASTCCVGVARENGILDVANLGDSGFIIVRDGKVHYASSAQTHAFNTPFQLAMVPKKLLVNATQYGGSPFADFPDDACNSSHVLQYGDIVLFATDGLWDNLHHRDILRIVSNELELRSRLRDTTEEEPAIQITLAQAILRSSKSASKSTTIDSPFAKEVQKRYPGENFHGGKSDDICILVLLAIT